MPTGAACLPLFFVSIPYVIIERSAVAEPSKTGGFLGGPPPAAMSRSNKSLEILIQIITFHKD